MSTKYDVIKMENPDPCKYNCYFCKRARNVDHWAFITDSLYFRKSVPCCSECAEKIKKEKNK